MTMIVVLPFTFGLDPLQGLAAMTGVYVGRRIRRPHHVDPARHTGQALIDRHDVRRLPDGEEGRAGPRAVAGRLGVVLRRAAGRGAFLILATGPLARIALEFGPWEFFALFIFALSMVAGLVESSLAKGLVSGGLGLIVTILGNDPVMGQKRLTFGIPALEGGIDFLPVLIGVFAFAQIMSDVEKRIGAAGKAIEAVEGGVKLAVSHLKVIWEILSRPVLLLWSSFVGVMIGVLPAIGGSAANMMAYDQAKKFSRHPERFGTGTPEGIIASEASNNANVGGSLVTIMAFGIPGDAVTAVMLGALTIHGIQSGPLFISQHPTLAYGIFAAYILAHFIMIAIMFIGVRWFLRIVSVRRPRCFRWCWCCA